MEDITLRPYQNFIARLDRPYLLRADIAQLEQKLQRRLKEKLTRPDQAASVATERRYLALLKRLRETWPEQPKVPITAVTSRLSKIIAAAGYGYQARQHKAPTKNTFNENLLPTEYYDLAFYNRHKRRTTKPSAHHEQAQLSAVFYLRCEEVPGDPAALIIGNLQAESPNAAGWTNKTAQRLLTGRKNIDREMVQQAVKHALARGKTRIIFQAGSAVEYAQWGGKSTQKITVTEKNFPRFQQNYQRKVQEFNNLKPGAFFTWETHPTANDHLDLTVRRDGIVIENQGDRLTLADSGWVDKGLMSAMYFLDFADDSGYWRAARTLFSRVQAAYAAQAPEQVVAALQDVFTYFQLPAPTAPQARQSAVVREIISQHPPTADGYVTITHVLKHLQGYLEEFKLVGPLLKKVPELTALKLSGKVFYICQASVRQPDYYFHLNEIHKPVLGRSYKMMRNVFALKTLRAHLTANEIDYREKVITWYDKRLPVILKDLGLTVKKVPLRAEEEYSSRLRRGQGWEIIAGVENFKSRPLERFAQPAALLRDEVPLLALRTAAQKFGVGPAQLSVLNNWLGTTGTPAAGSYTPVTDTIKLANRSLAILTHEGWHRLVAHNLVPPKIYVAVATAGRGLVAPALAARIGAEECAALFVQNFYKNNRVARENLTDCAPAFLSRVLEYVQEIIDMLQAGLGQAPAQARQYLRHLARQPI